MHNGWFWFDMVLSVGHALILLRKEAEERAKDGSISVDDAYEEGLEKWGFDMPDEGNYIAVKQNEEMVTAFLSGLTRTQRRRPDSAEAIWKAYQKAARPTT